MPKAWVTLMVPFALMLPVSAVGQDVEASRASSGSVQVMGSVVDRTTEDPVPMARVVFTRVGAPDEPVWTGISDAEGGFQTDPLALGGYEIEVEAATYAQVSHVEVFPEEAVVDLRVEMVPVDYSLDPIVVVARRSTRLERTGFYRRQQQGIGYFVDHAEIEARNPLVVSDLFLHIPGVRVVRPDGVGGNWIGFRGGCRPQVVMDGAVMAGPVSLDDVVLPGDVEAMEVYLGPTAPIAYNSQSGCGTVVMWTRSPPEPTGNHISLKKFIAIVGFATFAVVATGR